jgi:hypothetical protein
MECIDALLDSLSEDTANRRYREHLYALRAFSWLLGQRLARRDPGTDG